MGEITSKRLEFLDTAKGIGIILVVLGHIYDKSSSVGIWIYSFHMPLFFIISGILLKHNNTIEKDLKQTIIKMFKSIVIPYTN